MKKIFVLIALLFFVSCSVEKEIKVAPYGIDDIAEQYVVVAHQIGEYDKSYVDAYFGPDSLKEIAKANAKTLEELTIDIDSIRKELESRDTSGLEHLFQLRHRTLDRLLIAMAAKVSFLKGESMTFDEESQLLYDAVSPSYPKEHYDSILIRLDELVPGSGELRKRYNNFRNKFIIPREKVDTVFKTAIAECRKRTLKHINLLEGENFTVEYVYDRPWGAYNWFKGNGFSLIQVNLDLPIYIERAIDLACHEGYPGHHVFHSLIEKNLVLDRGWVEYSVYPLYSPLSLISEGAANYGINLAFPEDERLKFEKDVLLPLAGLEPEELEKYYEILEIIGSLKYAGNEAARNYLDGKWGKEETIDWLMTYQLRTGESAVKYLSFIEKYRSYVINYNVGKDLVAHYIKNRSDSTINNEKEWLLFIDLISNPVLPGELK